MTRRHSLLVFIAAGVAVACPSFSPSWRGWGSGFGNRFQAESNAATGVVRWASTPRDNLGPAIGCPILWADKGAKSWTDSRIFVGSASGIHERLPLNLNLVSDYQSVDGVVGCPSAPYDLLFFSTSAGHVVALLAASSPLAKKWDTNLGMGSVIVTSPTSDGTNVYVAAENRIFALRVADGSIAWEGRLSGVVSPIAAVTLVVSEPEAIVVSTLNGHVQAFERFSGAPRWDRTLASEQFNQGVAAVGTGNLYVAGFSGRVYGISAIDGHQLWPPFNTGTGKSLRGPAVALRDNREWIYVVDDTPTLYVLDQAGLSSRVQPLPAIPQSNPVVGPDDVVYLAVGAAGTARVIALSPSGELWSVATSSPARYLAVGVNGDVYAAGGVSSLVAIK